MRAMRTAREHAGTPSPQALRPQPARPGTAGMGRPHGENAPEDPHGLPGLPRRHPQGKVTAGHGITREPDAMKVARPVRGGRPLGKGPATQAGTSPGGPPTMRYG